MGNPLEIKLSVPALETLLKYTKDIFEATIGSWIEPWQASQKSEAMRMLAHAEADQLKIVSEGQSCAITTLLETTSTDDRAIEVKSTTGNHSITAQGQKRSTNILKILNDSARKLENTEVNHHQPNPDWTARFALDAQDVSSEKLQDWWSRILAGEIQNPGQTSLRTLDVLKNMSPHDAVTFEELSKFVLCDSFLFSRDGFANNQFQKGTTINHAVIQHMQECRLVFESLEHLPIPENNSPSIFPYHSSHISIERGAGARSGLRIPMLSLTSVGRELYALTSPEIQLSYLRHLAEFLHYENHQLYVIHGLQFWPDGSTSYANKTHIMRN